MKNLTKDESGLIPILIGGVLIASWFGYSWFTGEAGFMEQLKLWGVAAIIISVGMALLFWGRLIPIPRILSALIGIGGMALGGYLIYLGEYPTW